MGGDTAWLQGNVLVKNELTSTEVFAKQSVQEGQRDRSGKMLKHCTLLHKLTLQRAPRLRWRTDPAAGCHVVGWLRTAAKSLFCVIFSIPFLITLVKSGIWSLPQKYTTLTIKMHFETENKKHQTEGSFVFSATTLQVSCGSALLSIALYLWVAIR